MPSIYYWLQQLFRFNFVTVRPFNKHGSFEFVGVIIHIVISHLNLGSEILLDLRKIISINFSIVSLYLPEYKTKMIE
jgi:spore maturation protein SpmB